MLMINTMSKSPTPLAFGSRVPRFKAMNNHPKLDPTGLFIRRPAACNPCLYHPVPMHEAYENLKKHKREKDPWRYKAELEDWSKNLGYRNQHVLEERRWTASLLGPAWTEVPSELPKYEPACKNVLFGRTSRFKKSRDFTPGPGTYYQVKPYKAPYGPHSTLPSFERGEACRFKDLTPNWSLAPDRYVINDKKSIENKSKIVVSIRGPYDLFTGKRDESTIKNHFSTKPVSAATWPLALPGSFEGYKKKKFGLWNKTNMELPPRHRTANTDLAMVRRKPTDPGPTSYTIEKEREFPQYKYGFNSSYDKPPLYQRTIVWPGVGRYNVAKDRLCGIIGQGHRHVFLSKIGRTIGAVIQEPMNSF